MIFTMIKRKSSHASEVWEIKKKKKNPKNFRSFKTVSLFLDFIRLLPSFILTEKVCTFFILFYLSFYFWFSFASKRSANEKILVCFSRFSFSSPI